MTTALAVVAAMVLGSSQAATNATRDSCNYADSNLVAKIVARVEAAERVRWGDARGWSRIVVDRRPLAKVMVTCFFRAYNNASDPAVEYVIGIDERLKLYDIAGFTTSQYGDLVRRWLAAPATERDTLSIVSGYLGLVEGWSPGLVQVAKEVPRHILKTVEKCQECGGASVRPAVALEDGGITVSGFAFDRKSTRLDYLRVRLTRQSGIVVQSRVTTHRGDWARF